MEVVATDAWPTGGDPISARMRAVDWGATALGMIARWPPHLKTTVDMLLRAPLPMALLWGDTGVLLYNEAFTGLMGGADHAMGDTATSRWSQQPLLDPASFQAARAGAVAHTQLPLDHGSAAPRQLHAVYTPVLDTQAQPAGVLVAFTAAPAPAPSASAPLPSDIVQITALLEQLPVGIGLVDHNGRWLMTNAALRQLTAGMIPSTDRSQQPRWRAWGQDGQLLAASQYPGARALGGETVLGVDVLHTAEGDEERWIRVSAIPYRGPTGDVIAAIAITQDIDAEKRAQEAQRRSEALYRALAANLPGGAAFVVDHTLRYMLAEGQALAAANLTSADLEGKTLDEALPADLAQRYTAHYRRALAGVPFRWEHQAHGRHYISHGVPLRDEQGAVYAALAVSYDISERIMVEAALRRSESRFRSVQETSIDGFMLFESVRDQAGRIVDFRWIFANAAAEQIINRPRGWAAGRLMLQELPGNRQAGIFDAYVRVVETGEPWITEIAYPHDGLDAYVRLVAAQVEDGFAVSIVDLSQRRVAERRLRHLQQVTSRFAETQTLAQVQQVLTDEVMRALGATVCVVRLVTPDVMILADWTSSVPLDDADLRQASRLAFDRPHPAVAVARHGEPIYYRDLAEAAQSYPDLAESARAARAEASAHLPLKRGEEVFGVLSLQFPDNHPWDAPEQDFTLAVADRVAVAYERARLFEDEQRARERAERLQALSSQLAAALTPGDVIDAVLAEGLPALGSNAGSVVLVDGADLELIRSFGYPAALVGKWRRFPLASPTPLGEAVRTNTSIWIESPADFQRRYGRGPEPASLPITEAWAALPLATAGEVLGAIGLGYPGPRAFDADLRRFAATLANLCAQALERARLFAAERDARKRLEETTARIGAILEHAPVGIIVAQAPDGALIQSNPQVDRIWRRERIPLANIAEYARYVGYHPDGRPLQAEEWPLARTIRSGVVIEGEEIDFRRGDGSRGTMLVSSAPIRDAQGRLEGAVVAFSDISALKQAEHALRESEYRLRIASEAGAIGIHDYHVPQNRVEWDATVRAIWGVAADEPITYETFAAGLLPADRPMVEAALQRAFDPAGEGIYRVEYRVLNREDGSEHWVAATGHTFFAEGRPVRLIGTVQDITERKRRELHAAMLADIVNDLSQRWEVADLLRALGAKIGGQLAVARVLFVEIDLVAQRAIVIEDWCAPSLPSAAGAYQLDDYIAEELLDELHAGRPVVIDDVAHHPFTAAGAERFAALRIGALLTIPYLSDGRLKFVLAIQHERAYRWRPDEVAALHQPSTRIWAQVERIRAEAALREVQAQRLAEAQQHAAQLQQLYLQEQQLRTRAEEADRLKDEFLATVSHELRTPLTAILGYALLLQRRKHDEAYVARTLEKLVRSAKVQAQLVEDLLDVARIVSGKVHVELHPTDMAAVVQAAVELVRLMIEEKQLQLQIDLDLTAGAIVGDADRLQQVVWNLLTNAIKFTPAGGQIAVRLTRVERFARLTVRDTGQGIAAEFLPFVFDRFRQANSSSQRASGGLGLGLAIVHDLVHMHGGTVQVASAGSGQGATFTVWLPLALAPAEPAAIEPAAPSIADQDHQQTLAGLRVLVVDDQPEILDLLTEMLTACGATVRVSATARAALETVPHWRPDVLISDIAMPGEDGYWLIRALRALPAEAGGATPALALTAYAMQIEDRLRLLAEGFQLYLLKPVDQLELRDNVARLARADPRP